MHSANHELRRPRCRLSRTQSTQGAAAANASVANKPQAPTTCAVNLAWLVARGRRTSGRRGKRPPPLSR
eukprot:8575283-Lingulodinium_polyedra.AAC.1